MSRLIGAPPGYVGFDQGGLLTEAITKKPHAVLLLDEIEKAHPDIFNVLLQVMDHGTLTDNNGAKADFRNVIIIMTTNAGRRDDEQGDHRLHQSAPGGRRDGDIKRLFTPEFRNRLDAIVNFRRWTSRSSCAWLTSSCCSWKPSWPRKGGSHLHRRLAQAWPRRASIRSWGAPHAAPHPGHHPPCPG